MGVISTRISAHTHTQAAHHRDWHHPSQCSLLFKFKLPRLQIQALTHSDTRVHWHWQLSIRRKPRMGSLNCPLAPTHPGLKRAHGGRQHPYPALAPRQSRKICPGSVRTCSANKMEQNVGRGTPLVGSARRVGSASEQKSVRACPPNTVFVICAQITKTVFGTVFGEQIRTMSPTCF